jgi:hypothetical protein
MCLPDGCLEGLLQLLVYQFNLLGHEAAPRLLIIPLRLILVRLFVLQMALRMPVWLCCICLFISMICLLRCYAGCSPADHHRPAAFGSASAAAAGFADALLHLLVHQQNQQNLWRRTAAPRLTYADHFCRAAVCLCCSWLCGCPPAAKRPLPRK